MIIANWRPSDFILATHVYINQEQARAWKLSVVIYIDPTLTLGIIIMAVWE